MSASLLCLALRSSTTMSAVADVRDVLAKGRDLAKVIHCDWDGSYASSICSYGFNVGLELSSCFQRLSCVSAARRQGA
jgi:hypothetical protein